MSKNQAEICKTFFKLLESENDTWLCKCGRKLKQRKGTENELSLTEILQCKRLKKHEDDEENQTPVIVESDFAEEILQKRQKKGDESKYLNCRFLFPTSNILERFFSAAGYALNDLRQNITPEHLEQQLFLRANKKYWTVKTVNSVLSD